MQAEEGIEHQGSREICCGHVLQQDAPGSAALGESPRSSRGLGNTTTMAHLLLSSLALPEDSVLLPLRKGYQVQDQGQMKAGRTWHLQKMLCQSTEITKE